MNFQLECMFPRQCYIPLFVVLFKLLLSYWQRGASPSWTMPYLKPDSSWLSGPRSPLQSQCVLSSEQAAHCCHRLRGNFSTRTLWLWKTLWVRGAEVCFLSVSLKPPGELLHNSWPRFSNAPQVSVLGKLPSDKFPSAAVNADMANAIF